MAELGQQTVEFSTLVGRAAEESFLSLKELVEKSKSSELSDTERKINLLKYIVKTQQRMLRLNVLAKWCQQVPLIQYCQQLASTLSSHDTCFTQTADSLFFMHEGLQQARAPIYDVPSAVEVLLTGSYQRLPKCIDDVGMQSTLDEEQQKPALRKLDTLVRSKLLEASFPGEISEVKVENGTALLRVDGEFKVLVTLGYRGHLSLWRILHLDLLVGERTGPVKLEETRRHVLGDDLERRMAASENPFKILYSVLHELCVALIMDTVIRQVHALRMGRWKDAIKFELISDGGAGQGGNTSSIQMTQDGEVDSSGHRIPGVKIIYWLDPERNYGASDGGSCPFIKIEPGVDLQIKCVHSSFVIDPATGKEADFYLDPSCIDVEKMLLKAICCNRYTRLLEMHKELTKNSQICRSDGDIFLDCLIDEAESYHRKKDIKYGHRESDGHEVLRIRAYGSSYFILGMNIRNGRYLLQSSRNIIAPPVLSDSEESLNQGSRTAAEVFINLRSKSILYLFASIGKFLGLQVYENGFAAAKIPKTVSNDSNYLLMGFPESGSSYLFLLQVDEDFKPLFKLVETQTDQHGKCDVVRVKRIEIGQMRMLEDDMNMSILDQGKISTLLPASGTSDQHPEHDLLSDFSLEHSMQISACPPSTFSSVVDEVFDLEKGTSASSIMSSIKGGVTSPKWEENLVKKGPGLGSPYNGSLHLASDIKGLNQSSSISTVPSVHGRSGAVQKLQLSKSAQDLASLRSPHAVDDGSLRAMDDDHLSSLSDSSKRAVVGSSITRHLSSNLPGGPRFSAQSVQLTTTRNLWNSCVAESSKLPSCDAMATIPVAQAQDFPSGQKSSVNAILNFTTHSRKRTVCYMLNLLPSLQDVAGYIGASKRRKLVGSGQQPTPHSIISKEQLHKFERYSYGDLIAEANRGKAPSSIYMAAFLHVVRHCSLCIKHAQLTSQMEALDIPYVQELCNANAFSNIWFRLPSANGDSWPHICLRLGRPGSMHWDVKINDRHYRDLWDLQKANNSSTWGSGVRIANTSDVDSHISYDSEGVVLSYQSVEPNSIKKLVADIRRLSSARMFALGMRKLLGVRMEAKSDEFGGIKGPTDGEKLSEQMRKAFRIEAVGFMSLWFSFGSGVLARFVVEWESGKEGCTMHVSPDGLWPHTKFLEDFVNGAEVASLLDCIRLTAGPLHALAAATRPARAGQAGVVPGTVMMSKQNAVFPSQGLLPVSPLYVGQATSNSGGNPVASSSSGALGSQGLQNSVMLATAGRSASGIVPSSLLPIDVSVVLRGPYWIRIIYRKHFAVDMRCFAGDQVWLQPATPPKGGPSVGGSLPCPQFRPFIMEHVAQELNGIEPNFTGGQQPSPMNSSPMNSNNANTSSNSQLAATGSRVHLPNGSGLPRSANQLPGIARAGNSLSVTSNLAGMSSVLPLRRSAGAGVPAHVRGELNTAIIGLGDDGGYGGGWVPLVALKKVLRGILKYLGVLWLFAQLPDLLKDILGSILKENEGALLNLDQEQPALRFFVGGYVFAVSVHRVQLLLQVLSVKRFQHSQQQQQNLAATQEELTQSEISEICDYFSRRVASEPYDASRVASFITLLTLPISVLREFLKLITWKRSMSQAQSGDVAPSQKPRVELCLENHTGLNMNGMTGNLSASKSNIHYDRPHNSVEFALTVVLDPAHIPHINAAGGAAWLPYCVSVRLRYSFGETPSVSFLGMEGSHGGRACWLGLEEWDKCKQRVARTIEVQGFSAGDVNQGRLRLVADSIQKTLHMCLQGLREGGAVGGSGAS